MFHCVIYSRKSFIENRKESMARTLKSEDHLAKGLVEAVSFFSFVDTSKFNNTGVEEKFRMFSTADVFVRDHDGDFTLAGLRKKKLLIVKVGEPKKKKQSPQIKYNLL